jgi:hypothetical protein
VTARCAVCRDERIYDDTPQRCAACGAAGGMKTVSVEASVYVPTREVNRPVLPVLARELEGMLG